LDIEHGMSDENSVNRAHWQPTLDYTDIDPARATAVDAIWERAKLPPQERSMVWRLPAPRADAPYCVLLAGRVLFERDTLREAAKVAMALRGTTVRQGLRVWGREELREQV
jgi:hypothetical protein